MSQEAPPSAAAAIRQWAQRQELAPLSEPRAAQAAVEDLLRRSLLDLPRPGGGRTAERLAALVALGAADCVLARLGEGHADATAILAELGGPEPQPGQLWGVWAAQPPGLAPVEARAQGVQLSLHGDKPYCSGAAACAAALVTAQLDGEGILFAVDLRQDGVEALDGTWPALGMSGSDSRTVRFSGALAEPVGAPGAYLSRPGFWHGAVGVAACWLGGAEGVAAALTKAASQRELDQHALAHLGAIDGAITAMLAVLGEAAAAIDADPEDRSRRAALTARRVRTVVEAGATLVVDRVGRALGAGPLTRDPIHARRVADLTVYLRQSHAERDLFDHGRRLLEAGVDW